MFKTNLRFNENKVEHVNEERCDADKQDKLVRWRKHLCQLLSIGGSLCILLPLNLGNVKLSEDHWQEKDECHKAKEGAHPTTVKERS